MDGSFDFYNGVSTISAANGDLIYGTYSGRLVQIAPPVYQINGIVISTGGTGRFANAHGEQIATGMIDQIICSSQ